MKNFVIVGLLCVVFGCRSTVEEDEVYSLKGKMMLVKSNKPFSGKVTYRFSNGKESSMFTYRNGYLDGDWYTKGFEGEKIQEGKYISCSKELCTAIEQSFGKSNYAISLWNEGDVSFITLYINNPSIDNRDNNTFQRIYINFLRRYKRDYNEIYTYQHDSMSFHWVFP